MNKESKRLWYQKGYAAAKRDLEKSASEMNKHTSGPWRFGIRGDDNEIIEKPITYCGPGFYDNPSIFGADGAKIVGNDEYFVFDPDYISLILSAPELLEALELLIDDLALRAQLKGEKTLDVSDGRLFKAQKAIAKAKGE